MRNIFFEPTMRSRVCLLDENAIKRLISTKQGEEPMTNIAKVTALPTELSASELDAVAAGQALINVSDVNVPVNVAVAANVLGGSAGALATQPGTIFKPGT